MDNAKIAETLKYLKDCWYSEYYTDDEYSDEQYDEITEVVDYVISDILNCKNEKITDFKVGDIVQSADGSDLGLVTHVDGALIYVMREDGTFTLEEGIDWCKVGRLNWLPGMISQIHDILEEY